jgi:hypothetical protein
MIPFEITRSRLDFPRTLNGVELAPEGTGRPATFHLGTAEIKRVLQEVDGQTVPEVSLGLYLTGTSATFACLFVDVPSAKAIAVKLLEAIGETPTPGSG